MKRSGFTVMARLIGLVRPLAGYMALAVTMGLVGHLCATFLTVLGGFGILRVLGFAAPLPLAGLFVLAAVLAVLRAVLRYGALLPLERVEVAKQGPIVVQYGNPI